MKIRTCALLFIIVLIGFNALAADDWIEVREAVICKDVVDREPVDGGTVFSADVEKLFCFTRIVGVQGSSTVVHVWRLGEDELARVPLRVGSPNWRTYSSKEISPGWRGPMKVEVLDASGNLLRSIEFRLVAPGEAGTSGSDKDKEEDKKEEQEEKEKDEAPGGFTEEDLLGSGSGKE